MTEPYASEPPRPPDQGPVRPAKPRSGLRGVMIGCLVLVAAVACVAFLSVVALVLLISVAAVGAGSQGASAFDGPRIEEIPVSGEQRMPKVVIVPVHGVLVRDGKPMGAHDPAETLKAMLAAAEADPDVAAILLEVESPGGGVTTCDIMHKHVRDYKARTGDPVVALMYDVAASGGYYVSCAADHILAHRTTSTGSIGVMIPLMDASGLLRMIGVSDRTFKSGQFKNMSSPFATKTEEERRAEAAIYQSVVDDMYARFVEVVVEGRGMPEEQVRKLADGRIYSSNQALTNGLIDELGYEEDAVRAAKELAGTADVKVVRYARMRSLLEMVLARSEAPPANAALGVLQALATPRPMYLWCPQASAGSQ